MKTITITAFLLLSAIATAQMYSWTAGVNPAWTSSNSSNNTLSWQTSITTVGTSGYNIGTGSRYTYTDNQVTTYTSPTFDFTGCQTSAYVTLTLTLDVNLENQYDWLYFQYSTNNDTTWTNPVAQSTSTNASGVNLSAYAPLTTYANTNSNRDGWTGVLGTVNVNYTIPKTANKFRYIFASDASVNSYKSSFTTYIYYADLLNFTVNCPTLLPVTLLSFDAYNESAGVNKTIWHVESEVNADRYIVERSTDGWNFETVAEVQCIGSSTYTAREATFEHVINYYRLSQVDNNGAVHIYADEMMSVDNRTSEKEVVAVYNLIGQTVTLDTLGVLLIVFSDGTIEKRLNE